MWRMVEDGERESTKCEESEERAKEGRRAGRDALVLVLCRALGPFVETQVDT